MHSGKLVSTAGFAALILSAAGCATKPSTSVTAQSKFEDLKPILMARFFWGAELPTKGDILTRTAQIGDDENRVPQAADGNFDKWCDAQGGKVYSTTSWDEHRDSRLTWPKGVITAMDNSLAMVNASMSDGSATSFTQRACDAQGSTYIQVRVGGNVIRKTQDPRMGFPGYKFAWISPQELAEKGPVAVAAIARAKAEELANMETEKKYARLKSEQAQRDTEARTARIQEILRKSPKGTQFVCSGRQSPDDTIADVWFSCTGKGSQMGFMTIAGFAEYGWRIGSQTLIPVLQTSGRVAHDATVIFEKAW